MATCRVGRPSGAGVFGLPLVIRASSEAADGKRAKEGSAEDCQEVADVHGHDSKHAVLGG